MSGPDPVTGPNRGCGDRHLVARFALWLIRRWYKHKDSTLAQRLHLLGAEFDPHPGDSWLPPANPNDIGRSTQRFDHPNRVPDNEPFTGCSTCRNREGGPYHAKGCPSA